MAGAKAAWGLDIGTTSLKAIKLRRDGDAVAVEAFDVVEHDKMLTEPDVDRDQVIRHTLQKFLERNPLKRDTLFIGVPGSTTFARFVKLPPVEPKKIPEIVRFEAIQQIPFPLDQVNWDYQTFQNADSPDVEVGIFAMKKELVAQVLSNFQSNNLTVHGVQMSPLAVYNAAVYDDMTGGKGTVIIDIGAEHTDLIVIDQGRLWLRTINIGGNAFTDALVKGFKQPFARAEQLKKTAATSKYAKQIFQTMRPVFADLVAEIQRSIGHYNSSHRDSKLERIIGMGNPFKLPNLQKYLQQELKMEVLRIENFRKATVEGRLAAGLNENILTMTSAYGLALQALDKVAIDTNLLPMEIARTMLWREKRPWFAAAAAAIVVAVGISGYKAYSEAAAFHAESGDGAPKRNAHQAASAKFSGWRTEYSKGSDTFAGDLARVQSFANLTSARAVWPSVLADVYKTLPQASAANALTSTTSYPANPQVMVITAVESSYRAGLSGIKVEPVPAGGGGGDFAPDEGMAPPVNTNVQAAGGGALVGPSDRGFIVTIRGYVPNKDEPTARSIIRDFLKRMKDNSPPPANAEAPGKPYYYNVEPTDYTGSPIIVNIAPGTGTPSVSGRTPWGGNQAGPFWQYFVPDILGTRPVEVMPMTGGASPFGGMGGQPLQQTTVPAPDAMLIATSPQMVTKEGKPANTLNGFLDFTITMKVHVR